MSCVMSVDNILISYDTFCITVLLVSVFSNFLSEFSDKRLNLEVTTVICFWLIIMFSYFEADSVNSVRTVYM